MTSRLRVNTIQSSAGLSTITVGASSVSFGDIEASNIEASKLTASTGILFGTDTAAVNTLDNYEEGTWTPVFAVSGFTYTEQHGTYTQIGNHVIVHGRIGWSFSSSTATVIEVTLPFTVGGTADNRFSGTPGYTSGLNTTATERPVTIHADGATAFARWLTIRDNNTPSQPLYSQMDVSGEIQFSIMYEYA